MRGIILAGGTGSRLGQLTKTINKHCLPVWDRPMICWPLKALLDSGISDITIVSSPSGVGQIAAMLGSGTEHGCRFTYRVQDIPGGVAAALLAAEGRHSMRCTVILGDNIFLPSPQAMVPGNSGVFLYPCKSPCAFGVPRFDDGGGIVEVIEKPPRPPSEFAVTGLYVFDADVFYRIRNLQTGRRGELEITDVLTAYARDGLLNHTTVSGFWGDAGTPKGLFKCSLAAMEKNKCES